MSSRNRMENIIILFDLKIRKNDIMKNIEITLHFFLYIV